MDFEDVSRTIALAAKKACWGDSLLEYDDLYSQSIERYLRYKDKMRPETEGGKPKAFLFRLVTNVANDMRTSALHASPQYTYRVDDVKNILANVLNRTSHVDRDALKSGFTIEDIPDVRADIMTCIGRLTPEDQRTIIVRYYFGEIPKNGSGERKRLDRAVYRLVRAMNGFHDDGEFVGSRKVISNAQARAMVSREDA